MDFDVDVFIYFDWDVQLNYLIDCVDEKGVYCQYFLFVKMGFILLLFILFV